VTNFASRLIFSARSWRLEFNIFVLFCLLTVYIADFVMVCFLLSFPSMPMVHVMPQKPAIMTHPVA